MNRLRSISFIAIPALLATMALAPLASADVLPPNDCTTAAGTSCSTAGPQFDQEGICTNETCHSGSPGAPPYACVLCELVDGGSEGDSSAPDAAHDDAATHDAATADATVADAGDPSTSLASSSKSCAVAPTVGAGAPNAGGAWLLGVGVIGMIGLALSRRRKV